jgi:glutaredoxin
MEMTEIITKRKVEVFTAGCPICDETVNLVKSLVCPSCDLKIYDLRESGMDLAKQYGINSVPSIVVNGKILDCCARRKPTKADLKTAGIGQPL